MPVIVIAPWDVQCSLYFSSLPVLSPFLPASVPLPLQQQLALIHSAGIFRASCGAGPDQGWGDKNEPNSQALEELAEESAGQSPPRFPTRSLPLPLSQQPHLTHQTCLKTCILPSIFSQVRLNPPIPQGVFLYPLKEPHLGWGSWELTPKEGARGERHTPTLAPGLPASPCLLPAPTALAGAEIGCFSPPWLPFRMS